MDCLRFRVEVLGAALELGDLRPRVALTVVPLLVSAFAADFVCLLLCVEVALGFVVFEGSAGADVLSLGANLAAGFLPLFVVDFVACRLPEGA